MRNPFYFPLGNGACTPLNPYNTLSPVQRGALPLCVPGGGVSVGVYMGVSSRGALSGVSGDILGWGPEIRSPIYIPRARVLGKYCL
jgi:hypothetical protein